MKQRTKLFEPQLYDGRLDFEQNKAKGPFGDYASIKTPYKNRGEPAYDFFGTPVYSPFGIAAGPLPTVRHVKAALDKGYDIATLKSVRTELFPISRYPHVRPVKFGKALIGNKPHEAMLADEYSEPLSIANSFGIPSAAPKEWQPYVRAALRLPQKGQALIVAFQGTARGKGRDDFVKDHVQGIGLIRETGARVIEINLSCPNEGEAILACYDTGITERIVDTVRSAYPKLTFTIKLAYFPNHAQLRELVRRIGKSVDGICAINTIPAKVVDANGSIVFPGRLEAGISGASIKKAGLEMTKLLNECRNEFGYHYKIIGTGGVLTPNDFHEYRTAGADIVMSVTGAMWDPNLAAEIKATLAK
jgi:dihydroorotate dehydrogenase (NAD+) catalytic subunit